MKALSENLKRLRESRNVSKSELGRLLDIAPSAYSVYETGLKNVGDREPTLTNLVKLADYFNVSIDELLNHNVDEFKRCKDLWESAGFKVQSQDGKIFLKQLPLEKYFKEGKYGFAGYNSKGNLNALVYGSEPMTFDNTEDFLELTQKMEESYQKNFLWKCREFFWDITIRAIGIFGKDLEPEIKEKKLEDKNFSLNYSLVKNETLAE